MSKPETEQESKIIKPEQPPRSIQTQTQAIPVSSEDDSNTPEIERLPAGPMVIKAYLKTLPAKPGVYRMFDRHGTVLYVGKAKELSKRVASYTRYQGHSVRIATMIRATVRMEFIITNTETEALLLEANLIKRLKPRYNVLLRDDKMFPYILITGDHEAPQITKHRGARKKKGSYFGPFAAAGNVNRTINTLQRLFLLRDCTNHTYENRTRPCLQYQIKRCSAPCTGEISLEAYGELVGEAKDFLSGKSASLQKQLQKKMEQASADLDFEQAAVYRDRIAALTQIQSSQSINTKTLEEADLFALYEEKGAWAVQVFFFRMYQNWGNQTYFPRADKSFDPGEVLENFIAQFYDNKPIPKQLIVSHKLPSLDLMEQALGERSGLKLSIIKPARGEKKQLIDHGVLNAKEALARNFADQRSQRKLLAELADMLGLEAVPKRIEIYDNSHIQGKDPVGAFVVADESGFVKNQYRKFNFKPSDIVGGDDFAMMREMITRRFKRLLKQNHQTTETWPDLLIIDGGKGQLSSVWQVLDELGVSEEQIAVIGVAKGPDRNAGREEIHQRGKTPFVIPERNQASYFLQRLRDEAHRFVIGAHRVRRKNKQMKNPLDEIAGIGAKRKKALLNHFGSAKAVKTAALKDLSAVDGISKDLAQVIYDHFHEG